jgi:uncharacterized membrane-anchored protein YhcB (DUF1043 family)
MFKRNFIIIGLIALLIIVLAIGGYFYQVFTKEKTELQATNKKLEEDLQESKDTLTRFQNEVTVLSNDLARLALEQRCLPIESKRSILRLID